MNPQAFYSHGNVEAQLAFLDRCDYLPIYRQAAKDWYQNHRVWRPVTEDECDYALNAVPPIACTSDCKLRNFEERFQTRFQAFEIAPPTAKEIITLLRRYLPDEPEVVNAANFADGNVRQALLDAKGLVQRSLQLVAA